MNTDLISRADAEALFRTARSKLNPSDYKTADEFNTRDLMLLNAEQMIHLLPSVNPQPCEDAISRRAAFRQAINAHKMAQENGFDFKDICEEYLNVLPPVTPQEPSNDMVSRGVFEQVMWERDMAIEQLKELGYGFGEKQRTGHWIPIEYPTGVEAFGVKEMSAQELQCSECGKTVDISDGDFKYCPYCKTKMVEPQESEVTDADSN